MEECIIKVQLIFSEIRENVLIKQKQYDINQRNKQGWRKSSLKLNHCKIEMLKENNDIIYLGSRTKRQRDQFNTQLIGGKKEKGINNQIMVNIK